MHVSTMDTTLAPPAPVSICTPAGVPLGPEALKHLVTGFLQDGLARLPGLLAPQALLLREASDRIFAENPPAYDPGLMDVVRFRVFEHAAQFRDLLVIEPVISVVEAILGANCHMVSQNVLRTPPGRAIDQWHVDETLYFPLPDEVPRHPMQLPVLVMTVFVLLSDVPDVASGPTQIVPGSCWSGRYPPVQEPVSFAGQEPVSLLGQAGDVYFMHNQCWHRGAPNLSSTTRYLLGTNYGRRYVSQRLYPFVNYHLPASVEAGADQRLQRVLGHHSQGTEGYA